MINVQQCCSLVENHSKICCYKTQDDYSSCQQECVLDAATLFYLLIFYIIFISRSESLEQSSLALLTCTLEVYTKTKTNRQVHPWQSACVLFI